MRAWLTKHRDVGLLVLRLGIGAMFIVHGYPKMAGGPGAWLHLGEAVEVFGIDFALPFWGFMAALAELGGGICLVLGLFVRPAAAMMLVNMGVAVAMHAHHGDGFNTWSHAAEDAVVFAALIVLGAGTYSLDRLIFGKTPSSDAGDRERAR